MNSLLLHLREYNTSLSEEMERIHERENRILKLVNKNWRHMMRCPLLMHDVAVQRRNEDQGLDGNRSEEEDDIGRINQIRGEDEFAILTRNPHVIH